MKLKQLLTNLPFNLTQAGLVKVDPKAPLAKDRSRSINFKRTLRASITTEELITVGTGTLEPMAHIKVLSAYARDNGIPMKDLIEDLLEAVGPMGFSSSIYRRILASIGGADRTTFRASAAPRVPPTYVLSVIETALPNVKYPILHHTITDFVCSMLRDTGWVMADEPYVYKVTRGAIFPKFQDLVDANMCYYLHEMLTHLSTVKIGFIKDYMDHTGRYVNPSQIASDMQNETLAAYDRCQSSFNAEQIVASVLNLLIKLWSTELPESMRPNEFLIKMPAVSEMVENLALFSAAQDMCLNYPQLRTATFPDQDMRTDVIGVFYRAMTEFSPFRVEPIMNVVGNIAKMSAVDHRDRPVASIIFEEWKYNPVMTAFTTVKHVGGGSALNGRFIVPELNTSSSLMQAMKPVHDYMSTRVMVERRLSVFDTQYASKRLPISGAEIHLALASELYGRPSITEADTMGPDMPEIGKNVTRHSDVYQLMLHLAVAKCEHVAVVTLDRDSNFSAPKDAEKGTKTSGNDLTDTDAFTRSVQVLVFRQRTSLIDPIGLAGIDKGDVWTMEPLEALMYVPDFQHVSQLEAKTIDLDTDRVKRAVHVWNTRTHSQQLTCSLPFSANIRNQKVTVTVDEHEALGLGVLRRNARFFTPTLAKANVSRWVEWMGEEIKDLEAYATANANDQLVVAASEGRVKQIAIECAVTLARMGNAGIGANISRVIRHKVAEHLYNTGMIDDLPMLHVGIERHRMSVWAGLAAMLMLGLLTQNEADWLQQLISQHDALALLVATNMA